ncbi:hypothetical protein TRFO_23191 [Tritrichomonas foetus]|uniref:Uncharacterized protein n=1 Tax=Tritrichomonas foetus TaxID=1144522 RepID=A0A1J4KFH7_9EUKA|nr:hypothetical protein TRFO_23191 [Tritrichomonas foetus]|eukprot:OHT08358.1 hypothetical protein TRFO_23191 [Tritrichomonas foetus]
MSSHGRRPGEIPANNVIRKVPNQSKHRVLPPIDGDGLNEEEEPEIEEDDTIIDSGTYQTIGEEEEDEADDDRLNEEEDNENDDDEENEEEENDGRDDENDRIKKMNELKRKKMKEVDRMCKDLNQSTQDFEDGRDSIIEKVTTNSMNFSLTDSLSAEISPMELLSAQLKIEQQKSEQLEKLLNEERERIKQLEEMLHEELDKNDRLQEELNQSNETINELKKKNKGGNAALQKELDRANDQIEELQKKLDKAENNNAIGLLREENESLMDQIEDLQKELSKKQKNQGTDKIENELKHSKEQLAIKDARIEQLNNKYRALSDENDRLQQQIEQLQTKASRPRSKQTPYAGPSGGDRHSRIPTRGVEARDPQRFGFKPRPTSAEDHLPPSRKIAKFPRKDRGPGSEDERPEPHPAPIVKKPDPHNKSGHLRDSGDSGGIVKRPKLGALKDPNEVDEYIEDKLPIKINKVDVAFGDFDNDDDNSPSRQSKNKSENKNDNKTDKAADNTKNEVKPPPRRAMVDNIKFGNDEEEAPATNSPRQHQIQQSSPPKVEPPAPNKRAMADNIKFGDDDSASKAPQIRAKAMESQISFNQPDPEPVQVRPPITPSGMSVSEIQAKVDKLNFEKAEIERQLNKAMPKAKIMTHIRKEREELEEHLEVVMKDISKLKLELHFAQEKKV